MIYINGVAKPKLSDLVIDADKDWNAKNVENIGDIKTDRWLAQDDNTFLGVDVVGAGNLTHTGGGEGYQNTFLGGDAGYSATTAHSNAVLGYHAGYDITTCTHNTILGAWAGNKIQGGSRNVLVGYAAGQLLVGGHENILIGYYAGASVLGGGNVFIGHKAGYNETGSNKLYIANTSTTRPLIYGEFDNLLLRFNSLAADAGHTLRDSPILVWRAAYWDGAASVDRDFTIQQVMDATTPKSTVHLKVAGIDLLQLLNDNGKVMILIPTENAKPAAAAAYRNALLIEQGGAGVADKLYWCAKNSADGYEWVQIAVAS